MFRRRSENMFFFINVRKQHPQKYFADLACRIAETINRLINLM